MRVRIVLIYDPKDLSQNLVLYCTNAKEFVIYIYYHQMLYDKIILTENGAHSVINSYNHKLGQSNHSIYE